MALDLEEDLDSFEGSGDGCHGDGGEETCGGNLGDGKLVIVNNRELADQILSYIITPERNGDFSSRQYFSIRGTGEQLTHGSNTHQRCTNTSI